MNRRNFIKITAAASAILTVAPTLLTKEKQNFDGRRFDIQGHPYRAGDIILVSDGDTETYYVCKVEKDWFIAEPISDEIQPGYVETIAVGSQYKKSKIKGYSVYYTPWDILS